jgi:hypothetical protein
VKLKYIFKNQDLVHSFMTGSCKLVANLLPPPRVCPDGQLEIGAAFQKRNIIFGKILTKLLD